MIIWKQISVFQHKYCLRFHICVNVLPWQQDEATTRWHSWFSKADERTIHRSQSTAPLPVLLPWSEFTNSKANGSRVPKFNLINTLCGDLQQPNVLLDRCTVRSAYSTPLEVLSYTETQFWICPESQKKRLRLRLSIYVVTIKITSGSRLCCDG